MVKMKFETAKNALRLSSSIVPYPPMLIKYNNKHINVYEVIVFNDKYLIGEIENEENECTDYYMLDPKELGTDVITDPEWKEVLDKGVEVLTDIVNTLKDLREGE